MTANGLDADAAAPTLVASPIMRADVIRAVQAISQLQLAGLPKNHPAKKAVFEGVDLPWEDEDEAELMAPRGFGFGGDANALPAAGEAVVDETVDVGAPAVDASAPVVEDKAKEAFNGAQVGALIEVVQAVASGTIPRQSGQQMLMLAFQLGEADALALLGPDGFTPAAATGAQQEPKV